jgi:predicted DNA-binding transcriptional regulator AlpA
MDVVGIKCTAIDDRIKAGTLPAPVQLGPRAVAWDESAIAEWRKNLQTGVKASLLDRGVETGIGGKEKAPSQGLFQVTGGDGGIRTHDTGISRMHP